MNCSKQFFGLKRGILVLIVAILSVSILLNVYLYFKTLKPPPEYSMNMLTAENIQGGMGTVSIAVKLWMVYSFEYKMLYVDVPRTFNVSIRIRLWTPYTGSATKHFSFKLYQRPLKGDYGSIPLAEKNVTVQKNEDEMFVEAQCILRVTGPLDQGIYIYRVTIERSLDYEMEFPLRIAAYQGS